MNEPSVLDYLKQLLTPWRKRTITLHEEGSKDIPPDIETKEELEPATQIEEEKSKPDLTGWYSILALVLAWTGQFLFEPPRRFWAGGLVLYILAGILFIFAARKQANELPTLHADGAHWRNELIQWKYILIAIPVLGLAALFFGNEKFSFINTTLWFIGIGLLVKGFLRPVERRKIDWKTKFLVLRTGFSIHWAVIGLAAMLILIAFYRFGMLYWLPKEMFSDHAEKLLDVSDVLNGNWWIFYPRNTGREAFQMLFTAWIAKTFGTGLSFMSLKLGTTLAGFFTLPFVFLLGKEIGGRRVAFFALLLCGIAYWPNIISRIGLRFPFYPLFAAPALYYFFKGLRLGDRNQFIWAGIALGLGLHGYSSARIIPIALTVLFLLFLAYPMSRENRQQGWLSFLIMAIMAFAVFLPLLRYSFDHPDLFVYRAMSRLSGVERPITEPAILIFLQNFWKSLIMPFWNNGNIWVHSIPNRPALDIGAAALYFFGVVIAFYQAIWKKSWQYGLLLISVPLLMLPSILSLAFPEENPSLNRSGAAYIPIFILAAVGLEYFVSLLFAQVRSQRQRIVGGIVLLAIISTSLWQNYDLVFRQFRQQFDAGTWNTSEIGKVIRDFAHSTGSYDSAFVVPYPYWVDTRLVGINAGTPLKDYAIQPEGLAQTKDDPQNKLFILNTQDTENLDAIIKLYPNASVFKYETNLEGKDFLIVQVPPMR